MIDKPPMIVLAQLDDVTVFQTAAFQTSIFETSTSQMAGLQDAESKSVTNKQMSQKTEQMSQTGQASYGDFNLGLHVNDNPAQVLDNRLRLLTAINEQMALQQSLPIKRLHWVNQVHGQQVVDVDNSGFRMSPINADAMISQQTQLGLAIMTADCVPIVLYQPATGQIAAIHAGWQGLACGVIKAAAARFATKTPIKAWLGASISQANYEVDHQVHDRLLAGCSKNQLLPAESIEQFSIRFSTPLDHTNKIKLDLPKIAASQLQNIGIHVDNDNFPCSYADKHYYSYRRQTHLQQPATGRMALVITRSLPAVSVTN